jgi:hypothetical protein
MRKLILFVFTLTTSSFVCANTTHLSCNVSGSTQINLEKEIHKPSQITVAITQHPKSLIIIIDGDDNYLASASTSPLPNSEIVNLSDETKFYLMNSRNINSGPIKFVSTTININRITGLITVSKQFSHRNGSESNSSYSGMCSRVSGKKF